MQSSLAFQALELRIRIKGAQVRSEIEIAEEGSDIEVSESMMKLCPPRSLRLWVGTLDATGGDTLPRDGIMTSRCYRSDQTATCGASELCLMKSSVLHDTIVQPDGWDDAEAGLRDVQGDDSPYDQPPGGPVPRFASRLFVSPSESPDEGRFC